MSARQDSSLSTSTGIALALAPASWICLTAALFLAACLFGQQSREDGDHVHGPGEVVDLYEGPVRFDVLVAQVRELDVRGETGGHGFDIVAGIFAERSGVERQPV